MTYLKKIQTINEEYRKFVSENKIPDEAVAEGFAIVPITDVEFDMF